VPKFAWPRPILGEIKRAVDAAAAGPPSLRPGDFAVRPIPDPLPGLPEAARGGHERLLQALANVRATATAAPGRQKGAVERERARLLYEAALPHIGSVAWTTEAALAAARKQFPGNSLLNAKGMRSFRTAWSLARQWLRQ
jgi:hypothetical protein